MHMALLSLFYRFTSWGNHLSWLYAGTFSFLFNDFFIHIVWALSWPQLQGAFLGGLTFAFQKMIPFLTMPLYEFILLGMIQRARGLSRKMWPLSAFRILLGSLLWHKYAHHKELMILFGLFTCFGRGLSQPFLPLSRQFSYGMLMITCSRELLFNMNFIFTLLILSVQFLLERKRFDTADLILKGFFLYPILFFYFQDFPCALFSLILYGILTQHKSQI